MGAFGEMQELLGDFLAEAGDLLDDVDRGLVQLERTPRDAELLNTVFRGFHTIKGGAGFLEATALVDLCHRTENLFDRLRSGEMALSAERMDCILAATGEVRRMFGQMQGGAMPTSADGWILDALAAALEERPVEPSSTTDAGGRNAPAGTDVVGTPSGCLDWAALYAAIVPVNTPVPSAPAEASVATPAGNAPRTQPQSTTPETTIRVDTTRFDHLLNLSGEIGLTKNRLACLRTSLMRGATTEDLRNLDQMVNTLDTLVGDLQSAVMKARMQPVDRVFQKYNRMARDVARQIGKEVELEIDCGATEVDKTILDALNDPLVHLVRNAVDHGIETPAERVAAGKPAKARIRLTARQVGDRILIEIADDGRGMRPDALRAKALEKGLIKADAAVALDERACLALILLPGFSTKDAVTDLSGRGVGMDVVKTNIQRLKGRIDIWSEAGKGSRFVISLPLTLAILPVLMLDVCSQPYALPLSAVCEVMTLRDRDLKSVAGRPAVMVREQAMPLIDLAPLLGRERTRTASVAVIAKAGEQLVALGVDQCLGQSEVMLKPLEGFKPAGVAGATLAGDGSLVVILDLAELLEVPA